MKCIKQNKMIYLILYYVKLFLLTGKKVEPRDNSLSVAIQYNRLLGRSLPTVSLTQKKLSVVVKLIETLELNKL